MALDVAALLKQALTASATEAGGQWTEIRSTVTKELRILLKRTAEIAAARASGKLDDEDARMFFTMAHNNSISTVALATSLTAIATRKIIDAGLNVVKQAI